MPIGITCPAERCGSIEVRRRSSLQRRLALVTTVTHDPPVNETCAAVSLPSSGGLPSRRCRRAGAPASLASALTGLPLRPYPRLTGRECLTPQGLTNDDPSGRRPTRGRFPFEATSACLEPRCVRGGRPSTRIWTTEHARRPENRVIATIRWPGFATSREHHPPAGAQSSMHDYERRGGSLYLRLGGLSGYLVIF
jgi:hypothetical protein